MQIKWNIYQGFQAIATPYYICDYPAGKFIGMDFMANAI
jgi:hypothetical protein